VGQELGFDTDPFLSENENYQIDVVAVVDIATDFKVQATAYGDQASIDKQCAILSIDNLGQKTAENSSGDDTSDLCWGK
jgi:type IV pilus assembly protein PilE